MSWRKYFRRARWDAERAAEMEAHLQLEVDANIARGMSAEEARYAAKRKLGNETKVREEIYRMNSVGFLDTLWQDVKYGARTLRKSPGYTLVAIVTLALGIGANTVIFSVINTVLLRPLAYPEVNRLVLLFRADQQALHDYGIDSKPDYEDWKNQSDVFSSTALFDASSNGYNLSEGTHPERLQGVRITADFFKTLGVVPMMGREFLAAEEPQGSDREVILSYAVWKRRYQQDHAILGKVIRIDGVGHVVVGVMPENFKFQFWGNPGDLFIPIGYTNTDQHRGSHSFAAIARLKPEASQAQATAELDAIGKRDAKDYPDSNSGTTAVAVPLASFGVSELRPTLMVLFYVVGFVLLIACVNVANLSLARSSTRHKEIAVRRALGAGRFRVMRQLLTESVLLAFAGCCAGLLLALGSLTALENALPDQLKYLPFRPITDIPMDARVFAFALAVTCATAILFGIAPAFMAERTDPGEALKSGGGRGATRVHGRLGHGLVAAEVALALVVVASAGLLIDSVTRILRVDPGYSSRNVLTMSISTPQTEIFYSPPVNGRFCQQLQESVGTLTGVEAVSAISMLPLHGNAGRGIDIEDHPVAKPEDQLGAGYIIACPNSFAALGVPITAGRDFTDADTKDAPGVAIVNESMAKKFWPNENVVGRRMKLGRIGGGEPWMTVVGVARDVRQGGLDRDAATRHYRQRGGRFCMGLS
jgi:predicted permease